LKVKGPVLTRSSAIGEPGFDAVMARGKFPGPAGPEERFYLPGALVKGLLREAWQELSAAAPSYGTWARLWLGDQASGPTDSPQRGALHFTDFVDASTPAASGQPARYRIQLEETRGAASAQMIQVIESPYAPGSELTFQGTIRTTVHDPRMDDAILRGLLWIRAAGGNRGIGFGEVLGASLTRRSATPAHSTAPSGDAWNLRLSFSQPVVFSKRRISGNLFESGEVIPGAALTGAIATMIGGKPGFDELAAELSSLRFTHAFPASAGKPRPLQVPLSLVKLDKEDPKNAIRLPSPPPGNRASFRIDWKENQIKAVFEQAGWPVPLSRDLRVRTAIASEVRKARDEGLFAWQALVPHGLEWVAAADVSALSPTARDQLASLLSFGIEPLGKTKACATVSLEKAPPLDVPAADDYIVTLQTPALLIDPAQLHPARGAEVQALRSEYERAWRELSPALTLVNYFGACSLVGGEYYHRRFRLRQQYKPYLLTDAGSTFLLKPCEGQQEPARAALQQFARTGLPLRQSICTYYSIPELRSQQWEFCPYTPNNGYGEIVVNPPYVWPEA
jgi:hypothetical protein